jgi:hypothetical protein
MAELKQQRRIEEVAPGLVRLVDGDTYVYLSTASADVLADKYSLPRVSSLRSDSSARLPSPHGAPNA